jgi:hypothetical protein
VTIEKEDPKTGVVRVPIISLTRAESKPRRRREAQHILKLQPRDQTQYALRTRQLLEGHLPPWGD